MSSFDTFLEIQGIEGESKDAQHPKTIQVTAYEWSMDLATSKGTGGSVSAPGKAEVNNLVFHHEVDKASPLLMKSCLSGKPVEKATLFVRKAGGDKPLDYFKIIMTNVIVASVNNGGKSAGADKLTEQVGLAFDTVRVEYQEQDAGGKPAGGAIAFTYDVKGHKLA